MIVVKVGGSEGVDLGAVCGDVAQLCKAGTRLVLIHGGSHSTNEIAEKLGHPPEFVTSPSGYTSRRTDRRTLEIFWMVYCGKINKTVVETLQQSGINAVGLSGMDGRIWEGSRKSSIRVVEKGRMRVIRDDYTGIVEKVNTEFIRSLLESGLLPVLTPPAISYEGEAINVDGDRAAAATASALGAETLVLLSNVPGLLRSFPDASTLIPAIAGHEIEDALEHAHKRMRIKLLGAREALDGGVQRVILGDSRVNNPVQKALAGAGTVIGQPFCRAGGAT